MDRLLGRLFLACVLTALAVNTFASGRSGCQSSDLRTSDQSINLNENLAITNRWRICIMTTGTQLQSCVTAALGLISYDLLCELLL